MCFELLYTLYFTSQAWERFTFSQPCLAAVGQLVVPIVVTIVVPTVVAFVVASMVPLVVVVIATIVIPFVVPFAVEFVVAATDIRAHRKVIPGAPV